MWGSGGGGGLVYSHRGKAYLPRSQVRLPIVSSPWVLLFGFLQIKGQKIQAPFSIHSKHLYVSTARHAVPPLFSSLERLVTSLPHDHDLSLPQVCSRARKIWEETVIFFSLNPSVLQLWIRRTRLVHINQSPLFPASTSSGLLEQKLSWVESNSWG